MTPDTIQLTLELLRASIEQMKREQTENTARLMAQHKATMSHFAELFGARIGAAEDENDRLSSRISETEANVDRLFGMVREVETKSSHNKWVIGGVVMAATLFFAAVGPVVWPHVQQAFGRLSDPALIEARIRAAMVMDATELCQKQGKILQDNSGRATMACINGQLNAIGEPITTRYQSDRAGQWLK